MRKVFIGFVLLMGSWGLRDKVICFSELNWWVVKLGFEVFLFDIRVVVIIRVIII